MKQVYFLFSCLLAFPFSSGAQNFAWVREVRGNQYEYDDFIIGQAVDDDQNSYILGDTESYTFDMDPTPDGVDIIDNFNIQNLGATYLLKLDADGNYLWGHMFGDYRRGDHAIDIKIGTDGNIYAMLTIQHHHPTQNVINGFFEIYKISPDGTILSTVSIPRNYGNNNNISADSFDLDSQNNMFISGYFTNNITLSASNPDLNLSITGIGNYVMKLDPAGNFIWTKQIDVHHNDYSMLQVRPDDNINLILPKSSNYILYNIDGATKATLWEKEFDHHEPLAYKVSDNGIVILGDKTYYTTTDIDVDLSANNAIVSGRCQFMLFMDLDGNFVEVKRFGIVNNTDGFSFSAINVDAAGRYTFGGWYHGTMDFDASANTNVLNSGYFGDAFLLKYDENRNFQSVIKFGQELPLQTPYNICDKFRIRKIAVVDDENYLVGEYNRVCDFDPSPTSYTSLDSLNPATYNYNGFIQKLGPCNPAMPAASPTQQFCNSQNATISNLTPYSQTTHWYDAPTAITPLTGTTLLVDGHVYYVSRQIGSCPESPRMAVTVSILPTPAPPVAVDQTFCESESAKISDLVATGQNLKWYQTATSTAALSATTPLQNNTIYFVSQFIGCESPRTSVQVTINSTPEPVAASPQSFCMQDAATISNLGVAGQNIRWYDSVTGGNIISGNPLIQDGVTYYASQEINNCESLRVAVTVHVYATSVPVATSPQSFCSVQNPVLSDLAVTGSGIQWYLSASGGTALPASTSLTNGSIYYASQTLNNCESIGRIPIAVALITTLNANDYHNFICDDLNDGTEVIDLSDYNQQLLSDISNATFTYYHSQAGAELLSTSDQINTPSQYPLSLGVNDIYVRITSANGCSQVVQLSLTVVAMPVIQLPDIVPICENTEITIDAGPGFNSYMWSGGETTRTIRVSDTGPFTVSVATVHGSVVCSDTKSFSVVKSDVAVINDVTVQDWSDDENTITVLAAGSGDYEYSIDGTGFQDQNVFDGVPSGIYTVYVRDKNGCGVVSQDIVLLMYPRFFTPNGDGYNDYWQVKFSVLEPLLNVRIFDRYGKLIHQMPYNGHWDGKYNGAELPADDYWFVVTRSNGKVERGHFSLKR
ncbi:hypothetical protein HYN48_07290 [Flavobacterium magnum]|uniref:Ig-like domain-containing protein n=1 Tax=Flavobacterium magnum TaxID=2162713 RepID=A0A2S0RD81_9FLAO|nr:T9SS type B sorting domain-containing protein [Flavobacterium magnum]AWA29897.1 hypothetical protein HYN48_07290 [Flavobacterium magnum]